MQGSIITVDVSKGKSHYQGFLGHEKPFSKPRIVQHTRSGFEELKKYKESLDKKSGEVSSFVFEATGVYHKTLEKFFIDQGIKYYMISPLLSAKFRQTDIHGNKTDPLDCKSISLVYYLKRLTEYKKEDKFHTELRKLNRHYEDQLNFLRKMKVNFKSKLDIVFPGYDKLFENQDIYALIPLQIIKKYTHPEIIARVKEDTIVKYLMKHNRKHHEDYIRKVVKKVQGFSHETYSGCEKNDLEVELLAGMVDILINQIKECEVTLKRIIQMASNHPNFLIIKSVVGIGDNLAARIVAEIGDITRFEDRNQLISYAGIDPMIRQSGAKDGLHLRISKKGNHYLRCLLYLAVTCNIRLKKGDLVYQFYQKKRQQSIPLKTKAAKIAASHKLLVIIYGMCKNGSLYSF